MSHFPLQTPLPRYETCGSFYSHDILFAKENGTNNAKQSLSNTISICCTVTTDIIVNLYSQSSNKINVYRNIIYLKLLLPKPTSTPSRIQVAVVARSRKGIGYHTTLQLTSSGHFTYLILRYRDPTCGKANRFQSVLSLTSVSCHYRTVALMVYEQTSVTDSNLSSLNLDWHFSKQQTGYTNHNFYTPGVLIVLSCLLANVKSAQYREQQTDKWDGNFTSWPSPTSFTMSVWETKRQW